MIEDLSQYPIAIIEDRYSGTYSGGRWIAIAKWENDASTEGGQDEYISRLRLVDREGNGDDMSAMAFWNFSFDGRSPAPLEWLAVGDTPDAAEKNLRNRSQARERISPTGRDDTQKASER